MKFGMLGVQEVVKITTKRSSKNYKNLLLWNSIKKPVFNINYIINALNKEQQLKLEQIEFYKEYKTLTDTNIKPKIMNSHRVFDKMNINDNQFTFNDYLNHNTIVIQSCTGTGKTTAVAKHIKEYLSLVNN